MKVISIRCYSSFEFSEDTHVVERKKLYYLHSNQLHIFNTCKLVTSVVVETRDIRHDRSLSLIGTRRPTVQLAK